MRLDKVLTKLVTPFRDAKCNKSQAPKCFASWSSFAPCKITGTLNWSRALEENTKFNIAIIAAVELAAP
jgi:hypothetical protein